VGCLAANAQGEIFLAGETEGGIIKIGPDGRVREITRTVDGVTDLCFASDGTLLACRPRLRQITAFDEAGRMSVAIADIG
jgi:hypothetical protein